MKFRNLHTASVIAMATALAMATSTAWAQDAGADAASAPSAEASSVAPAPEAVTAPSFKGPFAGLAAPLAAKGVTLHASGLNLFEANPSLGLERGHSTNSLYLPVGVDANLGTLFGLAGTSLHFENVFFTAVKNLNIAPQIGDSQVGYQPAYTPRSYRLSRATIEQKLAGGRLTIEAGATHPAYFYAGFNCGTYGSCFQDILYLNARYTSYKFAVPGANIALQVNPNVYVQAGVFATEAGANGRHGYNFDDDHYDGTLYMAEIGYKSGYATNTYPVNVALTGFSNTANHVDYNAATALTGVSRVKDGTSGVVVHADKVIWRRDGGSDPADSAPTALKLYTSVGASLDSTTAIQSDVYVGANLMAPFGPGPVSRVGVKVNWEKTSSDFTRFLTAANGVSGGPGAAAPYHQNKLIYEASAYIQLPLGVGFEPLVQYAVHPNSYWNPFTPKKARDGVYVGAAFVLPIGGLLGLSAN